MDIISTLLPQLEHLIVGKKPILEGITHQIQWATCPCIQLLDTDGAIGNGIWGIIDSKRKAEVEEEDSRSSVGTWENSTSVVVSPARKGAA